MKIVVAANSFKGSISSAQAGNAIKKGVLRAFPDAEVIVVPVADGGDGMLDAVEAIFDGTRQKVMVNGPDFTPVLSEYCWIEEKKLAAIEMALASGLAMLPKSKHDPTLTTTLGTGELIKSALEKGAEQILVGIGGSATNDGGIGVASALGILFLDNNNQPLSPIGANLDKIRHIDTSQLDPRINQVKLMVACDVDNILTGEHGASRMYGLQKGATPSQIEELDQGLENLAACIRKDLDIEVSPLKGGGAAGGLGAGLHAFLGGDLQKGTELILDMVELDHKLANADLVITGEGQIDFQTIHGKAPAGVAARAKQRNIDCIALAGSVGDDLHTLHQHGLTAIFSLCQGPIPLREAIHQGAELLTRIAEQAVRCYFAANSPTK